MVGFYLVFKERFGVKVGFGANFLPGIVGEVGTVHMQGIFLAGGFYHLRRFTEIKVSTTSELFSTTSELSATSARAGRVTRDMLGRIGE